MSEAKVAQIRKLLDAAIVRHEAELMRAVAEFNKLTPSEQMAEQLRKWQALIAGDSK
jgi:hypothetical protein